MKCPICGHVVEPPPEIEGTGVPPASAEKLMRNHIIYGHILGHGDVDKVVDIIMSVVTREEVSYLRCIECGRRWMGPTIDLVIVEAGLHCPWCVDKGEWRDITGNHACWESD